MFNKGCSGSNPHPSSNYSEMKKQNTSYKAMLRDRTPLLVDLALKWCKAKECWINHVYDNFINIYTDKEQRYEATRITLGISGKYRNFDFEKTIAWDNLDKDEEKSWQTVKDWVDWFSNHATDIKNEYEKIKNIYTRDEAEMYLTDKFLATENEAIAYKLIKFIIDSL